MFKYVFGRVLLKPVDERDPEVIPLLRCARVFLVAADVPDVPFAGERERLALRQRLAFASLRGADRRDPCFDLGESIR